MNDTRTRILLPEYGRNVQRMVAYLKTIEDREKRNEQARVVVAIMGNLYPFKRDTEEFRHMLWDHLFMIANFDIDIDCPFEHPTEEMFSPRPAKVPYTQRNIKQKHYGANFRLMINKIAHSEEGTDEQKQQAALSIAKFIRQKSFEYNREFPSNEVVIGDILSASDGLISLPADSLDSSKIETVKAPQARQSQQQRVTSSGAGSNSQRKPQERNQQRSGNRTRTK